LCMRESHAFNGVTGPFLKRKSGGVCGFFLSVMLRLIGLKERKDSKTPRDASAMSCFFWIRMKPLEESA